MSEKKKVIYVKDLVIKADNVHIEPKQQPRPFDPFFGPRRESLDEQIEEKVEDELEERFDNDDDRDHDDDDHRDDDDERRPFSWI